MGSNLILAQVTVTSTIFGLLCILSGLFGLYEVYKVEAKQGIKSLWAWPLFLALFFTISYFAFSMNDLDKIKDAYIKASYEELLLHYLFVIACVSFAGFVSLYTSRYKTFIQQPQYIVAGIFIFCGLYICFHHNIYDGHGAAVKFNIYNLHILGLIIVLVGLFQGIAQFTQKIKLCQSIWSVGLITYGVLLFFTKAVVLKPFTFFGERRVAKPLEVFAEIGLSFVLSILIAVIAVYFIKRFLPPIQLRLQAKVNKIRKALLSK